MSDQVYRKLQERIDTHPVGFPASADDADIKMLKRIFTPEQAEIMCRLDWRYRSTEDIYADAADLVGSKEMLARTLHEILKNGGVFYRKEDGKEMWAIAPFVVGFYEFQVDRLTPEFISDINGYFASPKTTPPRPMLPMQLRVIPIEQGVTQDLMVADFDEVRANVEQAGDSIALIECICRKKHTIEGGACSHTSRNETCMAFHYWAEQEITRGTGRRLTQEEAMAVLEQNQKDGLVMMPSNSKTIEFLCSCCSDCCGTLAGLRAAERPAEIASTNYLSKVDEQLCVGCETCADACPMVAIAVDDGVAKVNELRCIGCGVCIAQCSSEAIQLMKKPDTMQPPETLDDLYEVYQKSRAAE